MSFNGSRNNINFQECVLSFKKKTIKMQFLKLKYWRIAIFQDIWMPLDYSEFNIESDI